MNAHQLAAFGEADVTADELRTWLTTPYVVVERDIRVLERDGRLVGYVDVDPTRDGPAAAGGATSRCIPDVDAGARSSTSSSPGSTSARRVGRLRVWTLGRPTRGSLDALARLGFEPVRHSYRMEIDLAGDAREPAWPDGITVRAADRRRAAARLRRASSRSGRTRTTRSTRPSRSGRTGTWSADFDPSLWFLALDGDELAGFSICRQDPNDPDAGHVALLGVRAALAAAGARRGAPPPLLRGASAARGWTRGTLGVDASSPTGAVRAVRARRDARLPRHGLPRAAERAGREPAPRPLPRLPDADRGRARAGVPVPLAAGASSRPASCACRAPGATAARRWPRRRSSSFPIPEAAVVEADTLAEQTLLLASELPDRPLVLGGCCCAHVGAIEALSAGEERLAVVWIDAHGDLNTPESSPSGNAWGMPLRMVIDDGAVAAAARCARRRPQPRPARGGVHRGERGPHRRRRGRARARRSRRRLRRVRRRRRSSRASSRSSCPSRTGCALGEVEELLATIAARDARRRSRLHRARAAIRRTSRSSPGSPRAARAL